MDGGGGKPWGEGPGWGGRRGEGCDLVGVFLFSFFEWGGVHGSDAGGGLEGTLVKGAGGVGESGGHKPQGRGGVGGVARGG